MKYFGVFLSARFARVDENDCPVSEEASGRASVRVTEVNDRTDTKSVFGENIISAAAHGSSLSQTIGNKWWPVEFNVECGANYGLADGGDSRRPVLLRRWSLCRSSSYRLTQER